MTFSTLIDGQTLSARLEEPDFRIVDCRYNVPDPGWGAREYPKAHIAGAVFASVDDDLSGPKSGTNGRHPLPDPVKLTETLGRLGIDNQTQVVVYDQDAGMYASRLWWLLRWLGHDACALLDGGFAKWTAEGRAVRSGIEIPQPRRFTGTPRRDQFVTAADVGRLMSGGGHRLVDARAPERFRGDVEPVDKVAGRIAGATNYPYQSLVGGSGTLRPPSEIRERAHEVFGDVPPERVICYCGSGVTACLDLLAFEHAGLHGVKLYPGSWSEWLSDPARPIERG
jgi:thiosulfate/3-mercaptopyruvate sulfurtransferase